LSSPDLFGTDAWLRREIFLFAWRIGRKKSADSPWLNAKEQDAVMLYSKELLYKEIWQRGVQVEKS